MNIIIHAIGPYLHTCSTSLLVLQGIIPGAGDIANALLNYTLVLRPSKEADLPDWLVRQMGFNNAVSAGVGFVPFVGDLVSLQFLRMLFQTGLKREG